MKTFVTIISLMFLIGCTEPSRDSEGRPVNYFLTEICVNGVVYYDGYYTLAAKFKPDSTVETCSI